MVAYGRRNGGAKEFVDKSRRGKFQEETYKITRENKKLALALPPTCKEMRKFANDKFPDWVLEMERHMKDTSVEIPEVMGGKDGLAPFGVCSCDLGNPSHIDCQDGTRSGSLWREKIPGRAKGWYFLMPNVHNGDGRPIAIELFDGIVIVWDGRIIRHCSSSPSVGEKNRVNGIFWGTTER